MSMESSVLKVLLRYGLPAAVLLVVCLCVVMGVASCMKKGGGSSVVSEDERKALGEAVMMLGFANEEVIRASAVAVELGALAADPKAYQGKWVYLDSEVE